MKNPTLTRSLLAFTSFLTIALPANMGSVQAQDFETFSVNGGMALNTNNNFRRIDGQPRMAIWQHNRNDPDQQFQRLRQPDGTFLLRHRSTGNCLNAHRLWNGAEINVWACNPNDPDQKFVLTHLGNSIWQIRRNGTNLCVDSPTRNNGGVVHLWDCNSSNVNQRWQSSLTPPSPHGNLEIRPFQQYRRGTNLRANNGYRLSFQHDGNLVLYTPFNHAIWATGTVGNAAAMLAVQNDGNVVLYDSNNRAMWATNTVGNPGAFLAIQADGNMVVYTQDGSRPLFATNTVGGVRRTLNAAAEWQQGSTTPLPVIMDANTFLNSWRSWPQYTTQNPFPNKGMNCTWYAHGRMLQLGYSKHALDSMLGNAGTWDNTAARGATVVNTPRVGTIAVWEAGVNGAGFVGHVAVVERVNGDGTITISESNWAGRAYNVRTIPANAPSKFIVVPR